MAVYATYEGYSTEYFGTAIAEADFPRLVLRASERIDDLTMHRAANYARDPAPLSMAACAIAEAIQNGEKRIAAISAGTDSAAVKSETVGGQNVSYAVESVTAKDIQAETDAAIQKAAQRYLWPTGLLSRWI